jgi:hypothetical protein
VHKICILSMFINKPTIIFIQFGIENSLFELRISFYSHVVSRVQYFTKFFIQILTALPVSGIKRRRIMLYIIQLYSQGRIRTTVCVSHSCPRDWISYNSHPATWPSYKIICSKNFKWEFCLSLPPASHVPHYNPSTTDVLMWQRLSRDSYLNLCLWMWCAPVSPHVWC